MQHLVVYFSPAGSTRLVADTILRRLTELGEEPIFLNLAVHQRETDGVKDWIRHPCCLWIGSPVYCDHAVPLVTGFIEGLPRSILQSYTIPFVTWGGVTSGLALLEMATQLRAKNYIPLAAAKVLAVHSSMWRALQPLALGHPNKDDLAQIAQMVDEVLCLLPRKAVAGLDLQLLDYLSPNMRTDALGKSLQAAKAAMLPLAVNEQDCLQCGECTEICPVAAITLVPFPKFNDHCVLCLQCVRTCPQQAFLFNPDEVSARIAAMAKQSDEAKETRIFCSTISEVSQL